jgi:hypothetical protein
MPEIKKSKFAHYSTKWAQWLLEPEKALQNRSVGLSSTGFFIGNLIGALTGMFVTSLILIAEFEKSKIADILKAKGSSIGEVFITLLSAYIATLFVSTILTSTLSFFVFKAVGSTRAFKEHISIYLEVTFLEPAACIFFSYALIAAISPSVHFAMAVVVTLIIFWFITRIWYLRTYWLALKKVHRLPENKFSTAYWFGHFPAFLLCHILLLSGVWTMVGLLVISGQK